MTDHHDLAEVERVDERRKILRIHDGGVARAGWIDVRIIVAPTVRNCPIMPGKWADLVRPIATVAQRTLDEEHARSCALFHVLQRNAGPNTGCSNKGRVWGR